MPGCTCDPPPRLHVRPDGVHHPDGARSSIELVDEVWADGEPLCAVCGTPIISTFYRCLPCATVICRTCLGTDTVLTECDCEIEVAVSGVQLAARHAAARVR